MSISYIKMLMNFDDSTLYDSISQTFFSVINSGSNTSIDITGLGYQMKQEQYLLGTDIPVDIDSSGFAISFWHYPINPGSVLSTDGQTLETLRMPVLTFAESNTDFNNTVIAIYENTNIDGTSKIEFRIFSFDEYGALDSQYVAYSTSYDVLKSHHFLFNISVEKGEIQIYIDGILSALSGVSGLLPSTFEHDFLDVGINKIYEQNYDYNLASNNGIIDDIGFFNIQFDAESILPQLINKGLDDFADIDLKNQEDFLQSTLLDDPTTIKVNAMIDDMSYVYLARNDGRILFGSPLLWESRRVFSNKNEEDNLNEFVITETDPQPGQIVNGFLEIKDSIIRL